MTFTLFHITIILAALLVGSGGAAIYYRRSNAKQPLTTPEPSENKKFSALDDRIHDLEKKQDTFAVTLAGHTEFITRSMNRISARQSKLSKKEEEYETMQELMEQVKETETDPDLFDSSPKPSNGHKPRIIRNSQRGY